MRAKGLLSIIMTGAMMMGVLSGCGFEPDIIWEDTAENDAPSYIVTVAVAHGGTVDVKETQTVKDGGTLNFTATPAEGDHVLTGILINDKDIHAKMPNNEDGTVKVSLQNINQDLTVVVMCDGDTIVNAGGDEDGSGTTVIPGTGTTKMDDVMVLASFGNGSDTTLDETNDEATISDGTISAGTVALLAEEVKDGGTAQIEVDPAQYYIADVTATVGGNTVTVVKEGDNTYSVSNVNGDVVFEVTFKDAPIKSVSFAGTGKPLDEEYKVGTEFDVSVFQAIIQYEGGDTKQEWLSKANATVQPEKLKIDTEKVEITYTRPDGKTEKLEYELNQKVVYLTETEKINIETKYYRIVNTSGTLLPGSDPSVLGQLKIENSWGDNAFFETHIIVNGKEYLASRMKCLLTEEAKEIEENIVSFLGDCEIEVAKKGKKVADVYMELDQAAGTCTVWAVVPA